MWIFHACGYVMLPTRPRCFPVSITRSVRIVIGRDGVRPIPPGGKAPQESPQLHEGLPAPHSPRGVYRTKRGTPQTRACAVWQTNPVRVYLASDHAGLELKSALVAWLGEAGHEAVDCS